MLHVSELGEHAHRFHKDNDGNVPEHGDDWRNMKFDHGAKDPNEEGISDEERQRRVTYLDETWWPEVIAQVKQEKTTLSLLPGGSPIKKWRNEVVTQPPQAHGFEVE